MEQKNPMIVNRKTAAKIRMVAPIPVAMSLDYWFKRGGGGLVRALQYVSSAEAAGLTIATPDRKSVV